jgi:chemotaxis protein CheD
MMKTVHVGIGEYAVVGADSLLVTVLGSCVGLVMYDKLHKVAGLAHIYLPDSTAGFRRDTREGEHLLSGAPKYADLLVPRLLEAMIAAGAEKEHFLTYVVGGASIYDFPDDSPLNIGKKNLEKTRDLLKALGMRHMEIKVGGKSGRHVTFDASTGDITVREFNDEL